MQKDHIRKEANNKLKKPSAMGSVGGAGSAGGGEDASAGRSAVKQTTSEKSI